MQENLTKYLSKVFRNEAKEEVVIERREHQSSDRYLRDPKVNQFQIDKRYSLRLDEII